MIIKNNHNSFIFSLVNDDKSPIKLNLVNENSGPIYNDSYSGPIFGQGPYFDFHIKSNSNTNKTSYSHLGSSYKHPNYVNGSNEAKNFLAGSHKFSTSE